MDHTVVAAPTWRVPNDTELIFEAGRVACVALDQGHAVVCIATDAHLASLERQLHDRGINVAAALDKQQYVALDASHLLYEINIAASPDETYFARVGVLVDRLVRRFQRVWMFSEAEAMLRAGAATSCAREFETIWSSFMQAQPGLLYCAYPSPQPDAPERWPAFLQQCEEQCRLLHQQGSLFGGIRSDDQS